MIGPFVFLTTEPFSMTKENPSTAHSGHEGDITIGQNVRIGAHSIILPGIKIGNGSSVGAGSVVTKDVPENTIYAGNPAKLIKTIS
jgi:maltose O-acetyltransferase